MGRILSRAAAGIAWLSLSCGVCGCGGDPEPGVGQGDSAPTTLSSAEAEAELAARVAHAFEPAPSGRSSAPSAAVGSDDEVLTVSARVLDREARGLDGATLAWLTPPAPGLLAEVRATARADSNGAVWLRIAWNELSSTEPLILALHAAGHLRHELRLEPARWMAGPLLSLGEVMLAPGGALSGRVLDAAGTGLAGVLVALTPELGPVSAFEREMARVWPWVESLGIANVEPLVYSLPDGRFTLEGAPTGRFDLVAAVFGERSVLLPERVEGVEIRAGETTAVRDMVLRSAKETELIRGRVLAPDGAPLAGIWIALGQADGKDIYEGRTFTAADGRFALPAMQETVFRVLAHDVEGRWAQAEVLDVRAGGPEVEVRFAPK